MKLWCQMALLVTAVAWTENALSSETLTLEECLRIAAERNLALAASRQRLQAAEASVGMARSARYPRLDIAGGYFRLQSPPGLDLFGEEVPLGRSDAVLLGLNAQQVIYSGGAIRARIEAAENMLSAEASGHRAKLQQIGLRVHVAFYGVLLAEELVAIRNASLEQLEAHLAQARERLRQGAASEFELLRAEVELANHRPFLVAAEHQLTGARELLTRLLGGDPSEPVEIAGALSLEAWEESAEDAVRTALSRRAELDAMAARVAAATSTIDAAEGGNRPTLSWFSTAFGTSPEYFLAPDHSLELNWIGGISMVFPLFDGFETQSRIRRARAELRRAEILRDDLEQSIRLEVREAYRRLKEAEGTVEAQARVIEQAERALSIAQVRYASGLGTQLEATDAQLALARARLLRLEAMHAHGVARAALRRAMGLSLFPPEVEP